MSEKYRMVVTVETTDAGGARITVTEHEERQSAFEYAKASDAESFVTGLMRDALAKPGNGADAAKGAERR